MTAALNRSSSSRISVAPSALDEGGLQHRPGRLRSSQELLVAGRRCRWMATIWSWSAPKFERRAVRAGRGRADDGLAVGRAAGQQSERCWSLLSIDLVHLGDDVAALEEVQARRLVGVALIAGVEICRPLILNRSRSRLVSSIPAVGRRRLDSDQALARSRAALSPFARLGISAWTGRVVSFRSSTVEAGARPAARAVSDRPAIACSYRLVEILPLRLGRLKRRLFGPAPCQPPPLAARCRPADRPRWRRYRWIVAGAIEAEREPADAALAEVALDQHPGELLAVPALLREHVRRLLDARTAEIGFDLRPSAAAGVGSARPAAPDIACSPRS